jgi:tetratricopeptide (TPR) repeat protein
LIGAGFSEQKATALGMFTRYIVKLIYPYELSYDYSFNQIPIIGIFSPLALPGFILLITMVFFSIRYFKKDIFITICLAFILLPLFLTGNLFFNIGATMADRFLFIPTIGSSLLITLLIFKLFKTDLSKNFELLKPAYFFVPILILFSFKTFSRNADWKSNSTLFAKDVNTVPGSARAHYNYGTSLMNNEYITPDHNAAAQKEFEACLSIDPKYMDAIINLGSIHVARKNYVQAIRTYRQGLLIDPRNNMLNGNIGDAFYRNGQPDSAVVYLEKARKFGNSIPGLYLILGTIWFEKKEYNKATDAFEKGIKIDNANWNLYINYGNSLAIGGRKEEALKAFERAYELNKDNVQPLYFIALTYRDMGDTARANKYYNEYMKAKK